MKQAQEMQWRRVRNGLRCEAGMTNLTTFNRENYTFRCCFDTSKLSLQTPINSTIDSSLSLGRFCFDETVTMMGFNFALPCQREPRDDEPCVMNNATRIPFFLRRVELCTLTGEFYSIAIPWWKYLHLKYYFQTCTDEGTCYRGTGIRPCNNVMRSADVEAIRTLLAQYRNNWKWIKVSECGYVLLCEFDDSHCSVFCTCDTGWHQR